MAERPDMEEVFFTVRLEKGAAAGAVQSNCGREIVEGDEIVDKGEDESGEAKMVDNGAGSYGVA